ncbi:MAG TPA: hypothetical protein VG479_12250 [Gaiellaceae bacterium]|jgi:hypothetical protein|nr:hypothetical protein [Gaiellaceae bacterium]
MIPSRAELLRRRRCRFLVIGMIFGVLLPIVERSWIALGVGLGGIAILAFVSRRVCRDEQRGDPAHADTHTRGPAA